MAGAGNRFKMAGYTFPKPLIPVQNMNGDPMVKVVIDNLKFADANHIFICRKEHDEKYQLKSVLKTCVKNCEIITIDYLTEGSACTCLLAKDLINNESPLIIADCDHFPIWDSSKFVEQMMNPSVDGGTLVFRNSHPKFSYVKTNTDGNVIEVKEKVVISSTANVGVYFWKRGANFVKYANQMISKNIRVNNEFYTAPVFNEAIKDGKVVKTFYIDRQWELGTPEDLTYFQDKYKP